MPSGSMYRRRSRAKRYHPRRRLTTLTKYKGNGAMTAFNRDRLYSHTLRGANRLSTLYDVAQMAHATAKAIHPYIKNIPPSHVPRNQLPNYKRSGTHLQDQIKKFAFNKYTKKGGYNKKVGKKKLTNHESKVGGEKTRKGKGFTTSHKGVAHIHGKQPKWKRERLRKYKYSIWQTTLISKACIKDINNTFNHAYGRIPTSNNLLTSQRFPLTLPDAPMDVVGGVNTHKRLQAVVWNPFLSAYSGTHTCYPLIINSAGNDLEVWDEGRNDLIQNKADLHRIMLPAEVDGTLSSVPKYTLEGANDTTFVDSHATVKDVANQNVIVDYFSHLVKTIRIHLILISNRPFPVDYSLSVIRRIKPAVPYGILAGPNKATDQKDLLNSLTNKGIPFTDYAVEHSCRGTLPPIKVGQPIPERHIFKTLKCNFMVSNDFQDNTNAENYVDSNTTLLGSNVNPSHSEVTDGFMCGEFYIILKYIKHQSQQVFQWERSHTNSTTGITESVSVPAVTTQGFDVGDTSEGGLGGSYFSGGQGKLGENNEARASMDMIGKYQIEYGVKKEPDQIPSLISKDSSNTTGYKKSLSLNVSPFIQPNQDNACYTISPDHVKQHVNIT